MANAISVAVGIPHPWVYSGTEPAIKKYTKAGVTTPALVYFLIDSSVPKYTH